MKKINLFIHFNYLISFFLFSCNINTENGRVASMEGVITRDVVTPFEINKSNERNNLQKLFKGRRVSIIEEREDLVKIDYPDIYIKKTDLSHVLQILNGEEFDINLKIDNKVFKKIRKQNSEKNNKKYSKVSALSGKEEKLLFEYEFGTKKFEYPSHGIINIFDINRDDNDDFIIYMKENEGSQRLLIFLSNKEGFKMIDFFAMAKSRLKTEYDLTYWENCSIKINPMENFIILKYGSDVIGDEGEEAIFTFKENNWRVVSN